VAFLSALVSGLLQAASELAEAPGLHIREYFIPVFCKVDGAFSIKVTGCANGAALDPNALPRAREAGTHGQHVERDPALGALMPCSRVSWGKERVPVMHTCYACHQSGKCKCHVKAKGKPMKNEAIDVQHVPLMVELCIEENATYVPKELLDIQKMLYGIRGGEASFEINGVDVAVAIHKVSKMAITMYPALLMQRAKQL